LTANDDYRASRPTALLKNTTKANNPAYHKTALAFASNSAHSYKTGKNVLIIKNKATFNAMFTPHNLMQHAAITFAHHFEHYANPMVHPVTGETISSYKKLMHNPATAKIWQTAFGKDFGGMARQQ
jgi:hypothetical protein